MLVFLKQACCAGDKLLRNVLTPQRLEVLCSSRPLKNALRQRLFFEMAHLALIFFSFAFGFKLEVPCFPTSFFNSFYTYLQSYSFNIDFAVLSSIDCLG